jgi:hypothetical protein
MSEEPFYIVLKNVKEHENGDATYTFDMSDKARDSIIEEGLTLMLYCGIAKVDIQDVYDWILRQGETTEPHEKPDTIWVDINDEGAVVAGGKGPAKYEGETTYVKASSLPEGRHPLSDDWFREKTAAFSYDEIRPMTDEERQRAKEREETNKCTP